MSLSKKVIITLVTISLISLVILLLPYHLPASSEASPQKTFTSQDLARYDGTDPTRPTYLAMDGLVYDISAGRDEFYAPGKPYHYIAGKDATIELKIAGGAIIRRKYPVVGQLSH